MLVLPRLGYFLRACRVLSRYDDDVSFSWPLSLVFRPSFDRRWSAAFSTIPVPRLCSPSGSAVHQPPIRTLSKVLSTTGSKSTS